MVDLARKNLLHDRLRFAITVSGVAFAVMLVFVQVGLFLGLLRNASITIEKLDADLWITSHNVPNVDFAKRYPEVSLQRVRAIPGLERADNLIVAFMSTALPSGAQETMVVYAMEDFAYWRMPWNVVSGDPADLRRGRFMFLDQSAVGRFGPFQVGDYREVLGTRLKIIGVTREARSFTTTPIAFMDYDLAQSLDANDLRGQTAYTLVKLAPGADVEAVRAEIRRRLPHNDVHTAAEWAQMSRRYWVQSTGLGLNMILTIFLGCLVGVVVVAQTLYTATMEHLKEFGTVKAIGGSNAMIYRILGQQAVIAAIVGFAIGGLLTLALRPALAAVDLHLIIPSSLAAFVLAGTVLLCLAASIVSFRKVAGIDPALVFRT
jgi:putative ABC transport system permease protein